MTGWSSRIVGMEDVAPDQLLANPYNARRHPAAQREALRAALTAVGWVAPVIANRRTGNLIDGHARVEEALTRGEATVPVAYVDLTEDEERIALATLDRIGELAVYDEAALSALLDALPSDLDDVLRDMVAGVDPIPYDDAAPGDGAADPWAGRTLAERFGEPPFTVLDARSGRWQERKRAWVSLGIDSGDGRDEALVFNKGRGDDPVSTKIREATAAHGTSIFDPVLAELAYRWFTPPDGHILDPFAGGSVRGLVAHHLGRRYTGIELRAEQVDANVAQAAELDDPPTWLTGDSRTVLPTIQDRFDGILSCPPYADLEVYSDDPADLSNMPWPDFIAAYRDIIARACDLLTPDRFAVWVVGEVRDPAGNYRGLVPETVRAFTDAGLRLYNEAVLVTPVATMSIRAAATFEPGRKLIKGHQNVLVFVKGDWRRAVAACGPCEFGEVTSDG